MVVGEFSVETELVVVGGGPGGYAAALRAAELGVQTTIVDDRPALGGTWLHAGCVLSKDLVHVGRTIRAADDLASLGVTFDAPRIDLDRLRTTLQERVAAISAGLEKACADVGVTRVEGLARFDDSRQLSIAESTAVPRLRFRRAVIATGSRDRRLRDVATDSPRVMAPADALALADIPATLLVLGGSSSALELASLYTTLGSRVTVAHTAPRLVPHADEDLVCVLHRQLAARLADIRLGTSVTGLDADEDHVDVTLRDAGTGAEETLRFDRVLVACGRCPNVEPLGLERTGIRLDEHGFIMVDEQLRTTDPRLYAVGDVVSGPALALKATHHGRIAAEAIAGWGSVYDARAVPMVLFTDPQIAWCGLTEAEAVADEVPCEVQKIPWAGTAPADEGFTKIIYDPDTRLLLGIAVVGSNAAELISEGALAIEMGAVTTDLAATVHSHPTHSESFGAAALRAETRPPSE